MPFTLDTSNPFELFLFCLLLAVTLTTVFQLSTLAIRWYFSEMGNIVRNRRDLREGRISYDEYLERAFKHPEDRDVQRANDTLTAAHILADAARKKRKAAQKRK